MIKKCLSVLLLLIILACFITMLYVPVSAEYFEGYFLGDADDNGVVESIDSVYVLRYEARMSIGWVEDTIWQADVDDTGDVDVVDATLIQRYLAEIPVKYSIGEKIPYQFSSP